MKLVIVESPAKAKTINKYLGNDYKVIASFGHIRDLPSKNGSVLPEKDFAMKYEISDKSSKYVNEIIKSAKSASEIYLATDPDREGESISWHVMEVLKSEKVIKDDNKFKRIAFNEITKKAVLDSIAHPRTVDGNLVNAQQARRALDYLVGFTLSPILWRKLPGCRSAGRVQSVALRLICEREDEIERFISKEFWDIKLDMLGSKGDLFVARLTHVNGNKLEKFSITNQAQAGEIVQKLSSRKFQVLSLEKKQQKRNPSAPFITSSLQQEASRKLGFSAKKTMQVAQKLYEGIDVGGETLGLITYMRTDGTTLAADSVDSIRKLIGEKYGAKYLPTKPIIYKSKSKNAQEAHEAIRPTDINLLPEKLAKNLDADQLKLYDLIWKRTVACQMEAVVIDMVGVDLISDDKSFMARATGSTIAFDGFYKIYQEGVDDNKEESSRMLPPLTEGEDIATKKIIPEQHFTEPPPRYSEATLVKKLEELGIGRPSTYATIISVLQDRQYVTMDKKRFTPSELGRLVTAFLVGFFEKYVQYDFTAELETDLDKIAEGSLGWKSLLSEFWKGFNDNVGEVSNRKISEVIEYVEKALEYHLFAGKDGNKEIIEKNKKCPSCPDGILNLKLGKFGAFLACNNYPTCQYKKPISKGMDQISDQNAPVTEPANNKELGADKDGNIITLRKGPYGWYVQLGEASSPKDKPKRSALPPSINPDTITLDVAVKLLNLPILIGSHLHSGEEILMGIGRFGPYLKYQNKFVSIPKNVDPFNVDIKQAMTLIEQKNQKTEPAVKTKAKRKKDS
ncbi:MAG: type I DNA topoisomerase [Rickettsiaceae bacterium]|nr:type I DNA topoisomerase [Rickettsiaceae bacterium]